jgi:hypothetical protein
MSETLAACRSSIRIQKKLTNTKVFFAFLSVFFFSFSVFSFMNSRGGAILKSAFLMFFSLDFLRVSYNCFIKKYCSNFIKIYFGDVAKTTSSIFKAAKSALGVTDPSEDPLLQIKHDVIWTMLLEDTLSQHLYIKVIIYYSNSFFLYPVFFFHTVG